MLRSRFALFTFALLGLSLVAITSSLATAKGPPPVKKPSAFPIQHIIFLVKENRTFDSYFGKFPGANGATTGKLHTGQIVPLTDLPDRQLGAGHSWNDALTAYDNGNMDGFDLIPGAYYKGVLQNYVVASPERIPNYYAMARDFVLSDNFFSSLHGDSFPNHLYTIAAQSGGVEGDEQGSSPLPAPTVYPGQDPGTPGLEPNNVTPVLQGGTWGCDAPSHAQIPMLDQENQVVEIYPCLDFQTLGDELSAAGISWAIYAPTAGSPGYIWSVYDAIRHIRDSSEWQAHVLPVDQFTTDALNGNLPDVTWISTPFQVSEHPAASVCAGENWTTGLVDALGSGPDWSTSALFITWDDWGGFYDHVAPQQVDTFGFGFRVPLLTISPYAKQGYIDHTQGEFSSVLKFVESDFGLSNLTSRDLNTTDLTEQFDFTQPPRSAPYYAPHGCKLETPTPSVSPTPTDTATPGPSPTPTATATPGVPPPPVLLKPQNGKTKLNNTPLLSWTSVGGASVYQVEVYQGSPTGPLADTGVVALPEHRTATLQSGSAYYWHVRACNGYGCGAWTGFWSFTVA